MMGVRLSVLSPEDYEKAVAEMLRASRYAPAELQVTHRKVVQGQDGEYEIDVFASFKALGVDFKVLVECKHHKNPVKREVVQILKDRLHSTGSHKGMIFSTAGFQSGAIEYAEAHGIALVQFADGGTSYLTRSVEPVPKPFWVPDFVGWMHRLNEEGRETYSLVSRDDIELIDEFLAGPES